MNNSFYTLPKEKQLNLFYAGCKVFANNTYKKASMSKVADEARISKSLLFYYFKNKKEYYFYVLNEVAKHWNERLLSALKEINSNDLFDMVTAIIKVKQSYVKDLQLYYTLIKRIYYEKDESLKDDLEKIKVILNKPYEDLFKRIDKSKFKDETEINNCVKILLYFAQGQLFNTEIDCIDEQFLIKELETIVNSLKRNYYKDEYLAI